MLLIIIIIIRNRIIKNKDTKLTEFVKINQDNIKKNITLKVL